MEKYFSIFLVLLLSTISNVWSQKSHLKIVARLPKSINESSGLTANPDGTFWTHNDSGSKPVIYKIDTLGNILKTLYLKGATAIDYEDISQDIQGNIYVCDCGNNANNRQNLAIYKISSIDISSGLDTITPTVIHYHYMDQHLFPPSNDMRNYDCEAMVILNDSIFLFSKNRGKSMYSKQYALPTAPGNYTARLVDSVKTYRWVTGAAISPDNQTLILLSENKLNIFENFIGSNFFKGHLTKIGIPITQKEGVTFKNNTELYLTDEKYKGFGGKIYYMNLENKK